MASSVRTAGPPDANAPRRKVRPAQPPAFRVEHSTNRRRNAGTDRRMNLSNEQEPFSLSELAAGGTAVAAGAPGAFLGNRGSPPPNPPPPPSLHATPPPDPLPSPSTARIPRARHSPPPPP